MNCMSLRSPLVTTTQAGQNVATNCDFQPGFPPLLRLTQTIHARNCSESRNRLRRNLGLNGS